MSGLSFLSKLVERIVAAQIRSHMDSHDLGNTFQSAYKVGHSTETALLCIKNEIHLALSKGMPTALVLPDLSAFFILSIMTHSYPVCQLGLALLDRH